MVQLVNKLNNQHVPTGVQSTVTFNLHLALSTLKTSMILVSQAMVIHTVPTLMSTLVKFNTTIQIFKPIVNLTLSVEATLTLLTFVIQTAKSGHTMNVMQA
ncbi:MAG: hypothetical protein EBX37_12930 [Alphaproteobacteria bacterium]|nr:hypothetical protein [Alphaproteobacteria bacterium]